MHLCVTASQKTVSIGDADQILSLVCIVGNSARIAGASLGARVEITGKIKLWNYIRGFHCVRIHRAQCALHRHYSRSDLKMFCTLSWYHPLQERGKGYLRLCLTTPPAARKTLLIIISFYFYKLLF